MHVVVAHGFDPIDLILCYRSIGSSTGRRRALGHLFEGVFHALEEVAAQLQEAVVGRRALLWRVLQGPSLLGRVLDRTCAERRLGPNGLKLEKETTHDLV